MRITANSAIAAAFPAVAPFALILAYVATVLAFRRSGLFDLTFHIIVLVLIGIALGANAPIRDLATAMLATLLVTSVFARLFGTGPRTLPVRDRRYLRNRTATLGRSSAGPPKPSDAR